MNEEKIIREEAREFYENSSLSNPNKDSSDKLSDLKYRLSDFYSPEFKAIFLDEIKNTLTEELKEHRDRSHGGKPSPTCQYEISAERLIFYLNQELGTLPKVVHQKYEILDKSIREKVFVSYCHLDKDTLSHLKVKSTFGMIREYSLDKSGKTKSKKLFWKPKLLFFWLVQISWVLILFLQTNFHLY